MLRAVTENVLLEIQKTFDFFKATAASDQIDRIMLSGGASRVDGFREMLQERFSAPVEEFDPFRAVDVGRQEAGRRRGRTCGDGGGRRRPRAAKGGRPMIRINLLGVERQKASKAPDLRRRPAADGRLQPDPRRRRAGIGWWYWSLRRSVGAGRRARSSRRSRSRRGCSRCSPRCSSSRRGARQLQQRVAADRAAARRPERSGAAARSRQPQPSRHAVADRDDAERPAR